MISPRVVLALAACLQVALCQYNPGFGANNFAAGPWGGVNGGQYNQGANYAASERTNSATDVAASSNTYGSNSAYPGWGGYPGSWYGGNPGNWYGGYPGSWYGGNPGFNGGYPGNWYGSYPGSWYGGNPGFNGGYPGYPYRRGFY